MKKPEFNLQCQIVRYLRYSGVFCFAVPNGGSRHFLEAVNLKRMGVMAGVADIIILMPNAKTVFIELKAGKGKQLESQKNFESKVKLFDFEYFVWRTLADAERFVRRCDCNCKAENKIGGTD